MESSNSPETLRGDEALALGALAADARFLTGYPGSPATGVFEALVARTTPASLYAEWAANEKVAVEMAIGAALAGVRSLVVLKSVGLNIALDPLATFTYTWCPAGLVILVGEDPGGGGSQNEQDTRWLARVAECPVIEVPDVAQAGPLMAQAFAWSEAMGLPIIVRVTTGLVRSQGYSAPIWELPVRRKGFTRKDDGWAVYPAVVVRKHHSLHTRLRQFQAMLAASPYDVSSGAGDGELGVLCAGHTWAKAQPLLERQPDLARLTLASAWPLPEEGLVAWLGSRRKVLVLEEGGPFVEEQLRALVQRAGLTCAIVGRAERAAPLEGELAPDDIARAVELLRGARPAELTSRPAPGAPGRTPLCPDCPYRPIFQALEAAMARNGGRSRHIVVGETGCMVRAMDSGLFDVKYSLGSALGIAIGLARHVANRRVVALVGDSCFFHSEINALAGLGADLPLTVIVLDNGATALTGGQPHPGSTVDARHAVRRPVSIRALATACGLDASELSPEAPDALQSAIEAALVTPAPRVLVVRGPCSRLPKEVSQP